MKRAAGILCHISSLPSPYGIGTFGREAYAFADFLSRAHQTYWQMLPLGPTGYGDSPYQASSAFAGNPYFIDLTALKEDGLLTDAELDAIDWGTDPAFVDYGKIYANRSRLLHLAFSRIQDADKEKIDVFYRSNREWLDGYALFCAVKAHFDMRCWDTWDEDIRFRTKDGIQKYRTLLQDEIAYHIYVQYLFYSQWERLRDYLKNRGIRVIGDVPIYVPYDSSDVWEHPELFQLDEERRPLCVAGVPPDYFSETGQLWGNPLYDYDRMAQDGYAWWQKRIEAAGKLFDVVRIDHFRGIESYWAVPYGAETAVNGSWKQGPGMALVDAIKTACPDVAIIAEDLGILTPAVKQLLSRSGFPGMRVLQFGMCPHDDSLHRPHNCPKHSVYYTGTHDNETIQGWIDTAPAEDVAFAVDYLNLTEREGMCFGLARAVWASAADLAIVQIQDILGLGSKARMNTPGLPYGNWQFRLLPDALEESVADRVAHYMYLYARG